MEKFCGSALWDENVTWYTRNPDFTLCFKKTVVIWIPLAILWLLSPLQFLFISKSRCRDIPITWLHYSKLGVTSCLIMLCFLDTCYGVYGLTVDKKIYPVDFINSILKLCTFDLVIVILVSCRTHGIPRSGLLFWFWVMLLLFEVINVRSGVMCMIGNMMECIYPSLSSFVYYILILIHFILTFFQEPSPEFTNYPLSKKMCPVNLISFPSYITFSFLDRIVCKGNKRPLEYDDLWDIQYELSSKYVNPIFNKRYCIANRNKNEAERGTNINQQRIAIIEMKHVVFANHHHHHLNHHHHMATNSRTGPPSAQFNLNQEFKIHHKQSVLPALCKCYWQSFISVISLNLCLVLLAFVNPLLLQLFITYAAEDPSVRDKWKGYFIAYCFLITGLAITIVSSQYYFKTLVIGLQIRMTLTSIIYKKALVLAVSSKKERTTGQIVNLMAVDVNRFAEVLPFVNLTWTIPLRLFIAIGFLTNILGYSVWIGLLVLILILPLQIFCATCHKKFSAAQMRYKDERMKLLMEVLNGFKAIRLYAWEAFFELQIKKKREKEISYLKKLSYLLAAMTFFWLSTPYLMAFGSFTCFVLVNASHQLTPHIAFVALSLFNLLQIPLALFPQMVAALVQASVSLKRINAFLNSDEMDEDAVTHDTNEADVIIIENGAFAWDSELVLSNINSRIAPGMLVAITGAVGSGKTSLLSALLGEIPRICGRVNVKGSIAYVPQQAWILNGTVRDNILFGLPYDKNRYEKVVEACSLLEDFQQFPAGDWTEIAGKGMNLSGGQKLRINLARAVYFDADIYLLDDPLSAVDYHVGNFIFEQVISQHGILKNKTRLVVTQNISTLHCYPRIIVLSDGKISEDGSFNQLLSNRGAFSKYLLQYLTDITSQAGGIKKGMQPTDSSLKASISSGSTINQNLSESQNQSSFIMHSIAEEPGTTESVSPSKEKITEEEYAETGKVKCKVYKDYLVAMGPKMVVVIFLLYCLYQIFMSGGNIWLAKFTDHHSQEVMVFLIVYALLGVGQLLSVGTAVLLLYLGGMIASKTLHNDMLHNILRVPIQFFSITPYGRVINRFSKDVDALDTILPISLQSFVGLAFMVAGSLVIIAIILPLFISFVGVLLILYFIIQRYYLNISRQLKRLESINRSPLYSHFEESLAGVSSIRAFGVQERFISENDKRMERCIVCIHTSFICDRWLQLRLELVGDILIFVTVLCAVINLGNVETGDVGLTVTYALTLTFNLNMLVRNASMVETNIVGAERIKEYIDIPREAAWHLDIEGVEPKWPEKGEITFENYKFAYRPGLDYVLNDISFTINGGEKVGIVGRTGAGKSSLTMALFRLFEAADGAIYIDGVDIATIGLSTLRSRLTIIPQDTVLLSGTLRMNLDPGYQYSDKKLRNVLETAHLSSYKTRLDLVVAEGGENFSVGERQLICLARALLRKTRILILDEATASIDLDTEELIQETIRKEFFNSTILTIAHRLKTIMDSDRVLVLSNGVVVEFDKPDRLLKDPSSVFHAMVNDTKSIVHKK